jgi:hypothetical protein
MGRLIDADELRKKVAPAQLEPGVHYTMPTSELDNAPSVDVVPVVRCPDCRYCFINKPLPPNRCVMRAHLFVRPDDYCSYGAKMEENGR